MCRGEEGWGGGRRVCPSQLISPQSAAPAAVARLQGGLQAGQSCHGGVVLSGGGEWIWTAAQRRGSRRSVGLGCEVLRFRCGAQVARLERVLRGEACGGRCCQDVQQVQRLMESRDGCHVSPVLLDGVKWSGWFGDTGAQMLCDLFEAHCALTRLPVWNGVNPVARWGLEDLIPAETRWGYLRGWAWVASLEKQSEFLRLSSNLELSHAFTALRAGWKMTWLPVWRDFSYFLHLVFWKVSESLEEWLKTDQDDEKTNWDDRFRYIWMFLCSVLVTWLSSSCRELL